MGASREKKARKNLQKVTDNKKQTTSSPGVKIMAFVVSAVAVVFIAVFLLNFAQMSQRLFAAMTVGDIKVAAAEYNIYFHSEYSRTLQSYESVGMEITEELHASIINSTGQAAEDAILRTVSMADDARKNGMVLSEENQQIFKENMEGIEDSARGEGLSVNRWLSESYGRGVNRQMFEKYLTDSLMAYQWSMEKLALFDYQRSDYDTYYEENKDTIDTVDFRYYNFAAEVLDEDAEEEEIAAASEVARAKADSFLSMVSDEASFNDAAIEFSEEEEAQLYLDNPDGSLITSYYLSDLSSMPQLQEWLTDAERKTGDKAVLESEDGTAFEVVYFVGRQRIEYQRVSVRHMLFKFDEGDEVVTPTAEQKKAAQKRAQESYDQWKAGEATEDSFAELANDVSDDGDGTTGGMIESFLMGEMVEPFEDWSYNSAREVGDTDLIESIYGYHVMYFSGKDERVDWMNIVYERMSSRDMDDYLAKVEEVYPLVKKDYGMSLTLKSVS